MKTTLLSALLAIAFCITAVLGLGLWCPARAADVSVPVIPAVSAVKDTAKAGHAYIGVAKCKICHMPYFKAWAETPHAKAFARLNVAKKEDKDPKCVKCHTTGCGTGGYNPAKATPDFSGVQCEACHGPGADYMKMAVMKDSAKAKAAGLIYPVSESVCVKCHNKESPNFKGFDYAKYLAKGVHKVEKKVPAVK